MADESDKVKALNFIQNEVAAVVDHSDPEEADTFTGLVARLLTSAPPIPMPSTTPDADVVVNAELIPLPASPDPSAQDSRQDVGVEACEGEIESASLSDERYQQRTEVFEALLEFVGERDKQPAGNLVDLVELADLGLGRTLF